MTELEKQALYLTWECPALAHTSPRTYVQVLMLCTVLFFLFFSFRKNQQMELWGSPHAEPHSCACALGRMEDTRSRGELPKKKAVQRSSAGRWWERNRLQFTRSYWAHQHETSAFDSNAKAGNAIILHKIWRHLFDPDYSFITALAQHLVIFHAYVLVELVEKNFFFPLLHAIQMRQC